MLALLLALQVSVPVADRMELLRVWAEAVAMHRGGQFDSHAERVSRMNLDAIAAINHLLPALVKVIDDDRAAVFIVRSGSGFSSIVVPGHELERLRDIAARSRARGGSNGFLKRAAVLHTDIGLLGRSIGEPSRALRRVPLARTTVFVDDGKQVALVDGVDHWAMARIAAGLVRSRPERDPDPSRDQDVRLWYTATAAAMLRTQDVGLPHFAEAIRLFPKDAAILMSAGAIRDMASAPGVHATLRRARAGFGSVLGLASMDSELRQAVALFREALDADTHHAEARLRLGGALGRLGRHQEAVKQLRQALAETTDPPLQYYGHMFLGRSLEQISELADARAAYERAAALAPDAQAPQMALSHLLMRTGDRQAALTRIDSTLAPAAIDDFEPMGAYYLSAGREADALMKRMYATLAPGP